MTEFDRNRMQEMIRRLNEASEAYYGGRDEIMSNVTSTSSKNTKARELGIPILSEEDFIAQFGQ